MEIVSKIQGGAERAFTIDVDALEHSLRAGTQAEVRFDAGSRALYATAAGNYRQTPIGVVIPRSEQDLVTSIALCRQFGAPIVARGGGTSLAGQTCNIAVVLDISKYLRSILELDPGRKRARVQPGVVLDDLRKAAEQHRLTFAPDPSTHSHCTLGGMIGNNSCGVHSVMGGKTVDNVESMRVLTYDGLEFEAGATNPEALESMIQAGGRRGQIYADLKSLRDRYAELIRQRYPKIPRRVSGYNLDSLLPENDFHVARALVGSEGTCVTVLEATLRLVDSPPARSVLVLGYPDIYTAGDHVSHVLTFRPIALEGLDDRLIDDVKKKHKGKGDLQLLPKGGGWLVVEFGGQTKEESDGFAQKAMEELKKQSHPPDTRLYNDKGQEDRLKELRESGLGSTAWVPGAPATWEGWEDAAVHPDKLGDYLRAFRKLLDRYEYGCDLYGHFGQGCVHTRIDFDLESQPGIDKYRAFTREAAELVCAFGGSLSGEHGDGQSRAELLPIMYGEELVHAFSEFKRIWDPEWKMNPGKIADPYRRDENLRLGTQYDPWRPGTHFKYPDDSNTFTHAALRCVGIGNCRREEGGTMCPSYMVTREEKDSTRGRSRLLFEMLRGEVIHDGWKEESVFDALDLCLSCKGCKGDCPVNVDMAMYKSEFLSHYYEGKLRPRHAYAIGYIHRWASLASLFPELVNFVGHAPVLGSLAKFAAGISQHRNLPPFASEPFKRWYARTRGGRAARENGNGDNGRPHVILWADTFNNFFHPGVGQAAVTVLEDAGCTVRVPKRDLCCGRPLYDYGLIDSAKRLLDETIEILREPIRAGVPIVVLEPSCAAVFRDELINIYPHDEDAQRLSKQTFLLSEFLDKQLPGYQPPSLHRKAIVHGHCHHRAVMTMDSEKQVLNKMGLDYDLLDSGCCGMAGGFGFEKEHYQLSVDVGERVLLPAVRKASEETLVIANGFSCREQILQTTDRRALHLAEVLQMAIRGESWNERETREDADTDERNHAAIEMLVASGAILAAGIALEEWLRRRA